MNATAAGERLNRFLARRGVASRRGADQLIVTGRVTVNGAPGRLGAVVDPRHDRVRVDGRPVARPPVTATFVLNKPAGVVTTRRDPHGRPTVMALVEHTRGLVPVGRLDADSRGLLLLTNDGELAHRLAHPRFGVQKRYRLTVSGAITAAQLRHMEHGVRLDDGPARALRARRGREPRTIEVVMGEGRRREVRRLCGAVGLEVIDLVRTAYGPVALRGLAGGRARMLTEAEDAALRAAVGLPPAGG